MLGKSFLTARGDLLLDLIILSLLIVVPTLLYSVKLARQRRFIAHRNLQVVLFIVLFVAIVLFEIDLKSQGGVWEMTKGSRFANSNFLTFVIYFHLMFSFSMAFLWLTIIPLSLWKYRTGFNQGKFNRIHSLAGKITIPVTIMAGLTGTALYFIGFHF